ncbi:MAG: xanthine dehydrogenase family protein subunit M [Hyphomicrobiales bacterium]|nr:xanthine dehydrogenase family protein subunit M [Hyphomicrobiales bacterium]
MKPAPFEYVRPASLEEAADILGEYGEEAKLLAGGQTLVPLLNFRLAAPAVIVDINGVPGLDRIETTSDAVKLGALVRWHQIETDPDIAAKMPLLAAAVSHIAHYQVRNRGTWAGSCAHADPAAEFPAIALTCGAQFLLYSRKGPRTVAADDFFFGPLTTALKPDEILIEALLPASAPGARWAFEEFSMRRGDFAIAGIAVLLDPTSAGDAIRCTAFGVGERARRLTEAEAILAAEGLTCKTVKKAAAAAAAEVDAQSDIHASADYRRALTEVLFERAVARAAGFGADHD